MLQFITFVVIYGAMMFIWSFIYLNKSNDKINQSFLVFLSVILLWMVLSVGNSYNGNSAIELIAKTIYWYSMLNMSVFFLLFIYRLIKKELDLVFYILVGVNTLTILSRYLFPIDYSNPTFWRLSHPVVAPLMSVIFSVPVVFALFLLVKQYRVTKDARQKTQLRLICVGAGVACLISVFSEYILPTRFNVDTHLSLMYFAVLTFVVYIFVSIMKHRLFNMQSEYIYRKLLLNSYEGIVIVNKNHRIISINNIAKDILKNKNIDTGDKITDYLNEYDFEMNYNQHEVTIKAEDQDNYLTITQYPIDLEDKDSAKLMTITDITSTKLKLQREKDMLIEKSSMDQLTGLYNKQYIDDAFGAVDPESSERKLVLLFIDVDNFKSINDLYGHIVGDIVLKSVAVCIKDCIGSNARAVRFGGDEFVIIFENAAAADVFDTAENIRKKANDLDFSQCDENLQISLSIGLAEGMPPVNVLIAKADMAMYRSKNGEKNKTTVYSEQI